MYYLLPLIYPSNAYVAVRICLDERFSGPQKHVSAYSGLVIFFLFRKFLQGGKKTKKESEKAVFSLLLFSLTISYIHNHTSY